MQTVEMHLKEISAFWKAIAIFPVFNKTLLHKLLKSIRV